MHDVSNISGLFTQQVLAQKQTLLNRLVGVGFESASYHCDGKLVWACPDYISEGAADRLATELENSGRKQQDMSLTEMRNITFGKEPVPLTNGTTAEQDQVDSYAGILCLINDMQYQPKRTGHLPAWEKEYRDGCKGEIEAVHHLNLKAENDAYVIPPGPLARLQEIGFIKPDGSMEDYVRNIVISSIIASTPHGFEYQSPRAQRTGLNAHILNTINPEQTQALITESLESGAY